MMLRSVLGGFVALVLTCAAAKAATLSATWNPAAPLGPSNIAVFNSGPAFSIQFDDDNNNGLFDLPELDSFSGLLTKTFPGDPGVSWDLVNHLVDIPGVAVGTGLLGNTGWVFGRTGSFTFTTILPSDFTYSLTGLSGGATVVPLPAALPLLVSGIGVLVALRRRRA